MTEVTGVSKAGKVRIVIWCDPDIRMAWRRYAAKFDNYQTALKSLLKEAGEYEGD